MLDAGKEFQFFAGTVFLDGVEVQEIGNRDRNPSSWRIDVANGFFKIVIDTNRMEAVGFLFDHQGDLAKGCDIDSGQFPSDCIVPIEDVEAATGLSFFQDLREPDATRLRDASRRSTWFDWVNAVS